MLNPVDAGAVIRDNGAVGRFPGEIHEGVAWWLGACLVTITKASRLYVGCDVQPSTTEFFRRLCRGATHARHHACHVLTLAGGSEHDLRIAMNGRGPGAYLATVPAPVGTGVTVTIRLYDEQANPFQEHTGLAAIRQMIADDRVPIPVNAASRGQVSDFRQTAGGRL